MLYKRLTRTAAPFDCIHDVIDGKIFHAEYDVDIIESEIEVAHDYPVTVFCELYAEVGADRRFADAAFPRRNDDSPCHKALLPARPHAVFAYDTTNFRADNGIFCRKKNK